MLLRQNNMVRIGVVHNSSNRDVNLLNYSVTFCSLLDTTEVDTPTWWAQERRGKNGGRPQIVIFQSVE